MSILAALRSWCWVCLNWLIERLPFLKNAESIPGLSRYIEAQHEGMFAELEESIKPYHQRFPRFKALPDQGLAAPQISAWVREMSSEESRVWEQGFASGSVYHGDREHMALLNEVYALTSQTNPLHSDIWPSINKFEAEIVAMTALMLGADENAPAPVGGTVTSGGSESIMLAMKTYRDYARQKRGIKHPEAIIPLTAHAAFDKACHYFTIKKISVAVGSDYRASVEAVRLALSRNTIVIVGSAPSFPHGVIDPIAELAALAQQRGIGFHTDACLGGFFLPWVPEKYQVPAFDFRVPGVSSISADTHKFGYASKGSSVLLFRDGAMRHFQYFVSTEWPGGLYFSPTFAGSRPGALIAQCWAAMLAMGREGYQSSVAAIMLTADYIKEGIRSIPELEILGEPLWVIAFTSKSRNIYDIMERMSRKGWHLNGLHRPPCVHICLTRLHTKPGVAERFVEDLRAATLEASSRGKKGEGMAPVYGMAAQIPLRGLVAKFLKKYMDKLYEV